MIATALSLLATALLVLLLMSTTLHSGGTSDTNVSNAPEVVEADNVVAQQSLTTALTAVGTAAAGAGGYGSVDPSSLTASDPSVSFVTGPTTNASIVSIALEGGTAGGSGASPVPTGGAIGAAISGAEAAGTGAGPGAGGPGAAGATTGSVTLAVRSADGTCWLAWRGDGSATWYGAQSHVASCTAPALSSPPSPGPVSASAIGWQSGTFPAA